MPFANRSDVEARIGRPLSADERQRVDGLLAEASANVRAYLGGTIDRDDLDAVDTVAIVTSRLVARCLVRDTTASEFAGIDSASTQIGPFGEQVTFSKAPNDILLMPGDKFLLKPYRHGGGFTTMGITSGWRMR